MAVDAIMGRPAPNSDGHIDEAFDSGETVQDLVRGDGGGLYLMGLHAVNDCVTSLEKVVEERGAPHD
jgi:hypothetical protein